MRTVALFRRGSTAIEFALMLPLLMIFMAAIIDWGWYMTQRVAVARATMDGARVGATVFEPSTVAAGSLIKPRAESRARDVLAGMGMPCAAMSASCVVTATYCNTGDGGVCNNPPFDALVLQLRYDYTPFFGFLPTPPEISDYFLMAVENQR
jgi:Flp pilus assembly protein TadG